MTASLPVMILLGASVLWGVTWWPLKQLNALGIEGIPLTLVAFGAISLVLLPLLIMRRRQWVGEGHFLLAIAVLGGYANLAFTSAMIYGEVVRVMVLFYLLPVWGVLGGRFFLGEHIDAARGLAVALALGGALLILGGVQALAGEIAWPDLLALSCGMAYAGNNLLFRARQALPVTHKVAAMLSGCFGLALVLVLIQVQPWPEVALHDWVWVVLYGLGWILCATAATQWAVTHLEAGRASILIIMELVTAVVTAMLFGGERMSATELLGGALILAAAVIEARRGSETVLREQRA
ncbi:MAG: DMT family transporter [Gammaproteobacteria bacterium]|nr:DMT family transporter [Gammaproteobacteria bacterium]